MLQNVEMTPFSYSENDVSEMTVELTPAQPLSSPYTENLCLCKSQCLSLPEMTINGTDYSKSVGTVGSLIFYFVFRNPH